MVVYIPTMGRTGNIRTVVPYWLEQDLQVRLVVDRYEYATYTAVKREMKWGKEVYILPTPSNGRGIGYVRNYCVKHASRTALDAIIMADDDLRPKNGTDMYELLEEAKKPGVLGIGATRSIHDLMSQGAVSRNHGPILCPGGWGFQVFALNISKTLDCGNFDIRLHSLGEDAELARHGIKNGIPWLVHCDVKVDPIGKRYAPGGINTRFRAPEKRTAAERECMTIIHGMWPDYTNTPDKPLRTAWQRMLDDFIPGWQEASAIHGGSLDRL